MSDWVTEALRRGLPPQQLELHLQPVVSMTSGMVYGAESFMRWRHPDRGLIPAGEWLPQAHSTGVIADLATAAVPSWEELAHPDGRLVVSFNVSGQQLLDPGFMDAVFAVPPETARCLAVEIAHLQFFVDVARELAPHWGWVEVPELDEQLAELRGHGFAIWLDDYGDLTFEEGPLGHSEVDLVKLDRSLLSADPTWLGDLVRKLSEAGKGVVMEGVETETDRLRCIGSGIDLAQGFLYSPPLPRSEFNRFCDGRS